MLPSSTNALGIIVEEVVYRVAFSPRKFVKCHNGYFLDLTECEELFDTLHLLHFPTNSSHEALNQGSVEPKTTSNYAAMQALSDCFHTGV